MASTHADFSQTDGRWSNNLLGFSSWETLARYGCGMAAGANILQAQGEDVTPADVNERLKAQGLFVRDSYGQTADFAGYRVFGMISPHTQFVEEVFWPQDIVAPADYFDVRSSCATEIMIEIDLHPEIQGTQTHFVRVIGLNDERNDVEIVDSLDGRRKWLSEIASRGGKSPFQIIWSAGKYQQV